MITWTLKYGATEQTLTEWGFSTATIQRVNQGIDTLTLTEARNVEEAGIILPRSGRVQLFRNDDANTRTPRVKWFEGTVTQVPRAGEPLSETRAYVVAGPWWYLENLPYQAKWWRVTDPENPNSPVVLDNLGYKSHVILNQYYNGAKLTTGGQIVDVVQYCIGTPEASNPSLPVFQFAGQLEEVVLGNGQHIWQAYVPGPGSTKLYPIPNVDVVFDEATDLVCAEVIKRQLRYSPNAVTRFDYSTIPPTLEVLARPDLESVTFDVNKGDPNESIQVNPRYDLVPPVVVIKYEQTNTADDSSWVVTTVDKFPADQDERQFQAMTATVNLQGSSVTYAHARIVCGAISPLSIDWWKHRTGWLYDPRISEVSIVLYPGQDPANSVTHTLGPSFRLAYELLDGQIPDWLRLSNGNIATVREDTITAIVRYKLSNKDAADAGVEAEDNEFEDTLSCVIKNTDAPTGNYSAVESVTAAEPVPNGLAEQIYNATKTLQFEGSFTLVEQECSGGILVGSKLNLTGGADEWRTMSALVQTVTEDLTAGRTQVTFGPATHLGAADLVELLRMLRTRYLSIAPSVRTTASNGGGGKVGLGTQLAQNNGNAGAQNFNSLSLYKNGSIIQLNPADMAGLKLAKFVPLTICKNGVQRTMYVLGTGLVGDTGA